MSALGFDQFFNRELSFLELNQRILDEASDPDVPLLERLKFLAITGENLDEFFMVRVAGLKQQDKQAFLQPSPDGLLASEQLQKILPRVAEQIAQQDQLFIDDLVPRLASENVRFAKLQELTDAHQEEIAQFFDTDIFPLLTPMAVDPGHPFPFIKNRRIHLAVHLYPADAQDQYLPLLAIVQVPPVLPRFVILESEQPEQIFVFIEDVIAAHAHHLFPGMVIQKIGAFRVLRNWDLEIDEDEQEDLLFAVENELRSRWKLDAVSLAVSDDISTELVEELQSALDLQSTDVLVHRAPLAIGDLEAALKKIACPQLRDPPFQPVTSPAFDDRDSVFASISRSDILLHHPYESYSPVVRLLREAATDASVLAIKQTLYRTNRNSPIVHALIDAANNGKQVVALVELKARFDEEANVEWARELEEAGVQVFYGMVGLKTHCKVTLVVRKEEQGIRQYVHLGTGNYNEKTALIYSDLSFFTADPDVSGDISALFNLLTGYSEPPKWNKLVVAPLDLRKEIIKKIRATQEAVEFKGTAQIIIKSNALIDSQVISALYAAASSGVKVILLIRGPCSLRVDIPGLSEGIEVRMIVDRFLEHSRVLYFRINDQESVYITSTDMMPRNFDGRVEVMLPIENPEIKRRIIHEILGTECKDNVKASVMNAEGRYIRVASKPQALRAQNDFIRLAEQRAAKN